MNRMIEMMRPGRSRTSDRTSTEVNRKSSRGTHTWRWWAGRTVLGFLLLVMALAAITLGAGARAKAALRASHPPIGQMVDVGGYKLHIACEGVGSPTVVLDAGAGDLGLAWAKVQPSVAKSTLCVCTTVPVWAGVSKVRVPALPR